MAQHWIKHPLTYISLALLTIVIFCLWPLGPHAPDEPPSVPTVKEGQETYLRQLELGWRFEANRDWEKAQTAYEEAALASQAEIAMQARNAISRVLIHQTWFWHKLQNSLQDLTPLWVTLGVILGLWMMLMRPSKNPGYAILPFSDYTEKEIGRGLHELIYFFIQEARHIHSHGQSQLLGIVTPEFPLFATFSKKQDALTDALSSLEAVNVGGINLPFSKIILIIRRWTRRRRYIIKGTLHQNNDQIRLYAEIQDTSTNELVERWELTISSSSNFTDLVQELAYRLLFHISERTQTQENNEGIEANSWRTLMMFSEGLQLLQGNSSLGERESLERARKMFEKVVLWDPGYITALYGLGITLTRLGVYSRARGYFTEVIETGDHLVKEATYNLGLAYYYEFSPWGYVEATKCFQKVLKETESAIEMDASVKLLRALAFAGLANVAAQSVGEDEYSTNEKRENLKDTVEENAEKAQDLITDQALGPQVRLVRALIYNARGIAAYYAEQFQDAQAHLKSALQFQPNNYVAYGYLALVSLSKNDLYQAKAWFECTSEWDPPSQYIEYFYYKFGRFYSKREVWGKAIENYSLAPNRYMAVNYLGESYAKIKNYPKAVSQFRKATKLHGKKPRFWLNLAYYITKTDRQDLLPEAEEAAKRAISIKDNWKARDILGWVYYHQSELEKAQVELQLSIKKNDQIVQSHYHLASVYQELGNLSKAIEVIEEGFKTKDKSPKWRKRSADLRKELREQFASDFSLTSSHNPQPSAEN